MKIKRGWILLVLLLLSSVAVIADLTIINDSNSTDVIFGKPVTTTIAQAPIEQTLGPNDWSIKQKNVFRNPLYYGGLGVVLLLLFALLGKRRKERQDAELEIKRNVKCEGCGQSYGMLEPECPFCKAPNTTLEEEEVVEEKTHTTEKQMNMENVPKGFLARVEEVKQKQEIKELADDKRESDEEKLEESLPRVKYKMKKCKGCGFDIFLDDKECQVCGKKQ
jgi:uncharacterized OB-fold protein